MLSDQTSSSSVLALSFFFMLIRHHRFPHSGTERISFHHLKTFSSLAQLLYKKCKILLFQSQSMKAAFSVHHNFVTTHCLCVAYWVSLSGSKISCLIRVYTFLFVWESWFAKYLKNKCDIFPFAPTSSSHSSMSYSIFFFPLLFLR